MAAETRLLVFANQADAMTALAIMNRNQGIGGQANSTSVSYAWPQAFTGGSQWSLPYPGDPDLALAGVDAATYFVSAGTQPVPSTVTTTNLAGSLSFRDKLPSAVVEAITCAATKEMVESGYTSAKLQVLMDSLDASGVIDLTTARVQAGAAYLLAQGLVTADQLAVALAPVGILPQAQWTGAAP